MKEEFLVRQDLYKSGHRNVTDLSPHDAAMSTSGFEVVSAMLALMVPSGGALVL